MQIDKKPHGDVVQISKEFVLIASALDRSEVDQVNSFQPLRRRICEMMRHDAIVIH